MIPERTLLIDVGGTAVQGDLVADRAGEVLMARVRDALEAPGTPALLGSVRELCRPVESAEDLQPLAERLAAQGDNALLLLDHADTPDLLQPRGHRAIGVVYHPEREHLGNYVPTVLPRRYDAFVFLDRTSALHPLGGAGTEEHEVPETFPWGE